MARFSIIIPLFGSTLQFEETLASVLLYRPEQSQVIVVHKGEYSDPYDLGKEVDFVQLANEDSAQPNLIDMFNTGVRNARGKWIGFIRPGVRLSENWAGSIEHAFENPEIAAISPVLVRADRPETIASIGVTKGYGYTRKQIAGGRRADKANRWQSQLLGPTNWAAFYRKSILNALGDCDAQLDAVYFDLDLGLSIESIKLGVALAADCRILLDDLKSFENESLRCHGCSAQRGFNRFGVDEDQASGLAVRSFRWSLLAGVASLLWRPTGLLHALGRLKAVRFSETDRVHRELLVILGKQKERFIAPGLHRHVLVHQKSQIRTDKRAA